MFLSETHKKDKNLYIFRVKIDNKMNLTKNIFILVLFLVLLSSLVSADDYYRRLGDGCNSENYFGSCESGCEWKIIGNSLSKVCEVAHGWCYDSGTCNTCDYVFSTNEHPIYYTCETIDCETYGNEPSSDKTQFERLYLYNLCEKGNIANKENPLSKLGSVYCKDDDNDGFGTDCKISDKIQTGYKKAIDLINMQDDCDDNNKDVNPNSMWTLDKDGDGRWDDMIIQCEKRQGNWKMVTEQPDPKLFDCNPNSDDNKKFPIGCFCGAEDEGKIINNSFCYNRFGNRAVKITDLETTFKVEKYDSGFIWANKSERKDFKGNLLDCPIDTCPIKSEDGNRYCAMPGSYWDDEGNLELEGGNNYCKYDGKKAFWGTRSSEINALFMTLGELSKKDFTVYCDNLKNIIQTTNFNTATPGFDSLATLKALTSKPTSTDLGQGCILLINTPEGEDTDYSKKILNGEVPIKKSQKVIFGTILNQKDVENKYFEVDFSEKENIENWQFGKKAGEYNGLIYDKENQILLIAQTKDGKLDSDLKGYIDQVINPNDITINFFNILVNPIEAFISYFNSDKYNPDKYSEIMATNFDKSYLSMNSGTYFYSILEGDNLISKIVNPGNELKKFIRKTCNKTTFRCDGVNGNTVNGVIGLTSNLASLNEIEKDNMWRKFSRQMRLQGNTGGIYNFRDGECTQEDITNCEPKTCFEPVSCMSNGMCNYVPITTCNTNNEKDGCCPTGCSLEDGDGDCQARPHLSQKIQATLRYGLNCSVNETLMLRLSNNYNAHVEDPNAIVPISETQNHFNNLLCIKTAEGNITANVRDNTCNDHEEAVLSLLRLENSHVAQASSTKYTKKLCLKDNLYDLNCKIDTEKGCVGFSVLASITGLENAHLAEGKFYDLKVCCNFITDKSD